MSELTLTLLRLGYLALLWLLVLSVVAVLRRDLFGTRVTLVPLRRADYTGDELRVPFDKVQLRNAPHHDPGNELSSTDEADLYRYYGIDYFDTADGFARPADHEAGQRTVQGDVRQERIEYDGAEVDTAEHDLRDTRF